MGTPVRLDDIKDKLPADVLRLHTIFSHSGFSLDRNMYYPQQFGDRELEYTRDNVHALVVLDRTIWSVMLSDGGNDGTHYYDMGILRYCIDGYDDVDLHFPEQVDYVEANLPMLLTMLTPAHAAETAEAIETFRNRRVRRYFPTLFDSAGKPRKRK